MKKVLITVCGRAGSKGFKNKNLKTFCGKPLVYYTLSAAELFIKQNPDVQVDIALNTDSVDLYNLVNEQYKEVNYVIRPESLGGDTVPKMAVFQHTLHEMESRKNIKYDYLIDLDITSPLRQEMDISGAFAEKHSREDEQLIFSVTDARRNPWFNQLKIVEDHVEKVIASEFTARQQAPEIFDVNASIYVFDRDFLANNTSGMLWDAKCGFYKMFDTGIIDIDSEEDYLLMEAIAGHLYATRQGFKAIQSNIRG